MADTMVDEYTLSQSTILPDLCFLVEPSAPSYELAGAAFPETEEKGMLLHRPADQLAPSWCSFTEWTVPLQVHMIDIKSRVEGLELIIMDAGDLFRIPSHVGGADLPSTPTGLPGHIAAEEQRLLAELPPEHRAQAERFVGRGHTIREFDSAEMLEDIDEDLYQ